MDNLGSPSNLNDQDMIPIYQLRGNPRTLQLTAVEREPSLRLRDPQLSPEMEAVISRPQQLMASTASQQLQFQNDVIVNVHGQGPVLEGGLPDGTNQQLQFQNDIIVNIDDQGPVLQVGLPEYNTGGRVEDPIWRLRLHATNSFTAAAIIGALFLPGELQEVHATYERAQLMATVGVPIAVAVSSFLASFRFASDPEGWRNWVTVLSWVNTGMFGGGPLAFYFMRIPGTGN